MSKRVPSRQDLTVRSRRAIYKRIAALETRVNRALTKLATAIADLWDAVPDPSNRKR